METILAIPKQAEGQGKQRITTMSTSEFVTHFKYYPEEALKKSINPILNDNPKSSFLFEIEGFGNYHVIFAFKNEKGKVSPHSKPQLILDYEDDISSVIPISSKDQIALETKVGKLSQVMIECFGNALQFYNWRMRRLPGGFVVDGHDEEKEFTMSTGGALGIKVSANVARYLNKTLKKNDNLLTKDAMLFITSSFVHEFTHYEKPMAVSIKSEAMSFLSEMTYSLVNNNSLPLNTTKDVQSLYDDLGELYGKLHRMRNLQNLGIHSKGEYIATTIIAAILSESNKEIRERLYKDATDLKTDTLKSLYEDMPLLINERDRRHLRKRFEDIMSVDGAEKRIAAEFETAVEGLGIKNAAAFISKDELFLYGTKRRG